MDWFLYDRASVKKELNYAFGFCSSYREKEMVGKPKASKIFIDF